MDKKLLMNVIEPEESRVAVLEDGTLEEFYVERGRSGHYAGNIYKGMVKKVEPSLQAAFVDFSDPGLNPQIGRLWDQEPSLKLLLGLLTRSEVGLQNTA